MDRIEDWVEQFLINSGVAESVVPGIRLVSLLFALGIVSSIAFWITRKVIIKNLYRFFKKTSFEWDDLLADYQVLNNLAHVVPAVLVRIFAQILFRDFEFWLPIVIRITDAYLIVVVMLILLAFLKMLEFSLAKSPVFANKPIASYFQLARIVIYIAVGIMVLSELMGRSPIYFLSAFGAMTAIILLIFKDTILGLVASVQMSTNDMVRVGDWVEMSKFNADGDVIAINLNTVKIQNWDKTVTSIPTYYFVTDSFKNWRGMQESGGRRIKRSIYINVNTVKFVDPETREHYKKYYLITDFVTQRQQEIEKHNAEHGFDTTQLINGRRMTNIGVFRNYVELYLRKNKHIRKDMTLLVRQMPIEDRGIPIEIYCFTNTTNWAEYEGIQSDIFDHLFAAVSFFDLEIFQQPSGSDIIKVGNNLNRDSV
ncbi:MAG TPA: mechanosensitive ion channel protein MscS [Bacteroidetes bacterium]|nr:mechanosensitive ion channel protein MscS [Bacteroidota bacterium]